MQVELVSLWLPIIVSGVVVFISSSLVWMVLQYHNSDWSALPDEEAMRKVLAGVAPGEYTVPHAASATDRKDPEWMRKYQEGPTGMLVVMPADRLSMGKQLGQWMIYSLIISSLIAYVGGIVLPAGSNFVAVLRVTGTIGVLAYAGATVPGSIWFGHGWGRTARDILDGVIYGLLSGCVFGWLWP